MQVNSIPSSQPNFKQINLVQVSKKTFKNPEQLKECSKLFAKSIDKVSGDKLGRFGNILVLLGLNGKKIHKSLIVSKFPSYQFAKNAMGEYNMNYSLSWLSQNTKLPIKDELDKEYRSFYVLTKEHIDLAKPITSVNNLMKIIFDTAKEGSQRYSDSNMAKVYAQTKAGCILDKLLTQIIGNEKVHSFKLSSLDELGKIADKLNF